MPGERIIVIDSRSPLMLAVFALRHEVFVREQSVPAELERDELDATATHLVTLRDGEVIGTLRITVTGETAKVGRMAVRASARKGGVGMRLLDRAAEVASQLGICELTLHAQLQAREFYRRAGYEEQGDVFEEAGIPHIAMRMTVEKKPIK